MEVCHGLGPTMTRFAAMCLDNKKARKQTGRQTKKAKQTRKSLLTHWFLPQKNAITKHSKKNQEKLK